MDKWESHVLLLLCWTRECTTSSYMSSDNRIANRDLEQNSIPKPHVLQQLSMCSFPPFNPSKEIKEQHFNFCLLSSCVCDNAMKEVSCFDAQFYPHTQ